MAAKLYLDFFRNGVTPFNPMFAADFSRPGIGVTKVTLLICYSMVIYCTERYYTA